MAVARRVRPDLLVLGAPPVAIDNGHLDNSTVYHAILESHCPVLLVPPGTDRGEGTIDKAVYVWLKKVQCIDGQPPLETRNGVEANASGKPNAGDDGHRRNPAVK